MTLANIDVEDNYSKKLSVQAFYNSIETYHQRVDKILILIQDYFDEHKSKRHNREFMAIEIIYGEVIESTHDLNTELKEKVVSWLRNEKTELEESIYTIELDHKIFLCKIFEFNEGGTVLAGYVLNETAFVRTFISKFSEKRIMEKYEKILSIT